MSENVGGCAILDTNDVSHQVASVSDFMSSDEEPLSVLARNMPNPIEDLKDETRTSTFTDSDTEEDERYVAPPVNKAPPVVSNVTPINTTAVVEPTSTKPAKKERKPKKPRKPKDPGKDNSTSKDSAKPKQRKKRTPKEKPEDKSGPADGEVDTTGDPPVAKKKRRKKKDKNAEEGADEQDETSESGPRKRKRKEKVKSDEKNEENAECNADDKDDEGSKKKRKVGPQRKNIRQIVNDKMLEGSTLDAQQEEMERKRRLEEVRAKLVAEQMAANEPKQPEPSDLEMDIQKLLSAADDETTDIIDSGVIDTDVIDNDVIKEAGINEDVINSGVISDDVIDTSVIGFEEKDDEMPDFPPVIDNSVIDSAIDEVIDSDSEQSDDSDLGDVDYTPDMESEGLMSKANRIITPAPPRIVVQSKSSWSTEKANSNLQSLLAEDSSDDDGKPMMSHLQDCLKSEPMIPIKHIKQEKREVKKELLSDSDDDCVIVKTEEKGDEKEEVIELSSGEEDKLDSEDDGTDLACGGGHINDVLNQPDEHGRVQVNIGHDSEDPDIFLASQISKAVKPHQIGGIRFLYDNVVESVSRFQTSNGFGCILAHSMGLGKTLQVIAFVDVFLRYTTGKHVLIIVPVNTLQNWISEFNQWLPVEVDEQAEQEAAAQAKRDAELKAQSSSRSRSDRSKGDRSRSRKPGSRSGLRSKGMAASSGPIGPMGMYDMPPDAMGMYGPGSYMPGYPGPHGGPHGAPHGDPQGHYGPMGGYPNYMQQDHMMNQQGPWNPNINPHNMGPMGHGNMGPDGMPPGNMGTDGMNPGNMGPDGQGNMRPGMNPGQMGPNMNAGEMGPGMGPNMGPGMGHGNMGHNMSNNMNENDMKSGLTAQNSGGPEDMNTSGYNQNNMNMNQSGMNQSMGHMNPMDTSNPNHMNEGGMNNMPGGMSNNDMSSMGTNNSRQNSMDNNMSQNCMDNNSMGISAMNDSGMCMNNSMGSKPNPSSMPPNMPSSAASSANSGTPTESSVNPLMGLMEMAGGSAGSNTTSPASSTNQMNHGASYGSNPNWGDWGMNGSYPPQGYMPPGYPGNSGNPAQADNKGYNGPSNNYMSPHGQYPPYGGYPSQYGMQNQGYPYGGSQNMHGGFPPYNGPTPSANDPADANKPLSDSKPDAVSGIKDSSVDSAKEDSGQKEGDSMNDQEVKNKEQKEPSELSSSSAVTLDTDTSKNDKVDAAGGQATEQSSSTKGDAAGGEQESKKADESEKSEGKNDSCEAEDKNKEKSTEDGEKTDADKDNEATAKDGETSEDKTFKDRKWDADEKDGMQYRKFKLFVVNDNCRTTTLRGDIVGSWAKDGGVLLMGYEMYRLLVSTKTQPTKVRRGRKTANSEPVVIDVEEEEKSKKLLADTRGWLTKSPGPDLVICDEGHRIKNAHASISQSLKNIKTKRRVVLTGYPLQNNLIEYWCMVDFVRPNYLGTRAEFGNMFERPISNGQCNDSTYKDVKLMKFRAHVLHSQLEGFVQRRGHAVLKESLPSKSEYVIQVKMSAIQRQLYKVFINLTNDEEVSSWANNNILKAFSVCCKIWNHPDILSKVLNKGLAADLDLDEVEASGKKKPGPKKKGSVTVPTTPSAGTTPATSGPATPIESGMPGPATPMESKTPQTVDKNTEDEKSSGDKDDGVTSKKDCDNKTSEKDTMDMELSEKSSTPGDVKTDVKEADKKDELIPVEKIKSEVNPLLDRADQIETFEWAQELMKDYKYGLLEHGSKMVILMSIIQECMEIGDKLLLFSQSLLTLNLIEEYLAKEVVPSAKNLSLPIPQCWAKNQSYFRLDGGTSSSEREKMINQFNSKDNDHLHLFLLSTRAGCLGINLIGANRVVVFDASWNPCHDSQAVCRVYRYGQQKKCHIYRLVMDNTMERKIYNRQVNKQGMSDRVVDEYGIKNQISQQEQDLLHYEDQDLPEVPESCADKFKDDEILSRVIRKHHNMITKTPYPHESLLIDSREHRLTKLEKRLAKEGYEREKKMGTASFSRPSSSSYSAAYNRSANAAMAYGRPMASVRPIVSSLNRPGGSSLPINTFLKPGVSLHQVKTTTDITIPGSNTSSDSGPSKIPAGETVLVIKTPRGVYIRTPQGKIFAVRAGTKGLGGESTAVGASGTSAASLLTSNTITTKSGDAQGDGKNKTIITMSAAGAQQLLGGNMPLSSNVILKSGQSATSLIKTAGEVRHIAAAGGSKMKVIGASRGMMGNTPLQSLIMSGKVNASGSKGPVTLSVKPQVKPKIIIPANMLSKQKPTVPVNVVDKASGKQLKIMIPSALLAPNRREEMRTIIEGEVKKLKAAIALEKAQAEQKKDGETSDSKADASDDKKTSDSNGSEKTDTTKESDGKKEAYSLNTKDNDSCQSPENDPFDATDKEESEKKGKASAELAHSDKGKTAVKRPAVFDYTSDEDDAPLSLLPKRLSGGIPTKQSAPGDNVGTSQSELASDKEVSMPSSVESSVDSRKDDRSCFSDSTEEDEPVKKVKEKKKKKKEKKRSKKNSKEKFSDTGLSQESSEMDSVMDEPEISESNEQEQQHKSGSSVRDTDHLERGTPETTAADATANSSEMPNKDDSSQSLVPDATSDSSSSFQHKPWLDNQEGKKSSQSYPTYPASTEMSQANVNVSSNSVTLMSSGVRITPITTVSDDKKQTQQTASSAQRSTPYSGGDVDTTGGSAYPVPPTQNQYPPSAPMSHYSPIAPNPPTQHGLQYNAPMSQAHQMAYPPNDEPSKKAKKSKSKSSRHKKKDSIPSQNMANNSQMGNYPVPYGASNYPSAYGANPPSSQQPMAPYMEGYGSHSQPTGPGVGIPGQVQEQPSVHGQPPAHTSGSRDKPTTADPAKQRASMDSSSGMSFTDMLTDLDNNMSANTTVPASGVPSGASMPNPSSGSTDYPPAEPYGHNHANGPTPSGDSTMYPGSAAPMADFRASSSTNKAPEVPPSPYGMSASHPTTQHHSHSAVPPTTLSTASSGSAAGHTTSHSSSSAFTSISHSSDAPKPSYTDPKSSLPHQSSSYYPGYPAPSGSSMFGSTPSAPGYGSYPGSSSMSPWYPSTPAAPTPGMWPPPWPESHSSSAMPTYLPPSQPSGISGIPDPYKDHSDPYKLGSSALSSMGPGYSSQMGMSGYPYSNPMYPGAPNPAASPYIPPGPPHSSTNPYNPLLGPYSSPYHNSMMPP